MIDLGATQRNLTAVSWAHAVNSQAELRAALDGMLNFPKNPWKNNVFNWYLSYLGDIDMIEADIVLGTLVDDPTQEQQPVMGHPPANSSDISLAQFLNLILEFNQQQSEAKRKGVKLDFKSTEVFTGSLSILSEMWSKMNYPVWINADILAGPVDNTQTKPVDADVFLQGCKTFKNAVLSIGWTTRWGSNFSEGHYTIKQIYQMASAIDRNQVTQEITFPVRAGIAADSQAELQSLYRAVTKSNVVTLTVWSSKNDFVDVTKLQDLICNFGLDKVYLDVPEELEDKLFLECSGGANILSTGKWFCLAFIALHIYVLKYLF